MTQNIEILSEIKARKEANAMSGSEMARAKRYSQKITEWKPRNFGGVSKPKAGKTSEEPKKEPEKKGVTQSFRFDLDPETMETLIELADLLGKTQTDILRMAIHDMGVEYNIVDGPWQD